MSSHKSSFRDAPPNSGLPEFDNIIVQVGNSRLGCAGPEWRGVISAESAARSFRPALAAARALRRLFAPAHPDAPARAPAWSDGHRRVLTRRARSPEAQGSARIAAAAAPAPSLADGARSTRSATC